MYVITCIYTSTEKRMGFRGSRLRGMDIVFISEIQKIFVYPIVLIAQHSGSANDIFRKQIIEYVAA